MTKVKKWILGIIIIILAIAGAGKAILDGDESTNVNVSETVSEVKEGYDMIKSASEDTESTTETESE